MTYTYKVTSKFNLTHDPQELIPLIYYLEQTQSLRFDLNYKCRMKKRINHPLKQLINHKVKLVPL